MIAATTPIASAQPNFRVGDERLIRLVLYGLRGPITVANEPFNRDGVMEMPGISKALDDQKIAAILTGTA